MELSATGDGKVERDLGVKIVGGQLAMLFYQGMCAGNITGRNQRDQHRENCFDKR